MWPFDPKTDIVFKLLFADERNRSSLISLLTAVLAPKEPIASVTVLNPDTPGRAVRDKVAILDLRVRLHGGSEVHVEMQRSRRAPFRERGLFYWARVHASQLRRGEDHAGLKPTIGIFILDFVEFANERFHNVFRLLNTVDYEPWSDSIALHSLELPKVRHLTPDGQDSPVLRWAKFFAASSASELEQLVMTYPDLQDTKEA
jgi:predicted transposase/invertase (TIGR01784 family)